MYLLSLINGNCEAFYSLMSKRVIIIRCLFDTSTHTHTLTSKAQKAAFVRIDISSPANQTI
jgi:hypothetical protein